jgi:hypothetical protein
MEGIARLTLIHFMKRVSAWVFVCVLCVSVLVFLFTSVSMHM